MPQSFAKIIIHIVFSTKKREPLIHSARLLPLHLYIAGVCRNHKTEIYRVGGTENHIHIACRLSRVITVAKLVEEIKKSSSKWMKIGEDATPYFQWQEGYGVFSISPSHLPALVHYIENQKIHHQNISYENEVRQIGEKYGLPADEIDILRVES